MTIIEDVVIRKILDSRGNPTVEVDVWTESGMGRFGAPSGASTGIHEVKAFPDGGLDKGISIFREEVVPQVVGLDSVDQEELDLLLTDIDGTEDLSRIGGNLVVALSLANSKAAADSLGIPYYRYLGGMMHVDLPYPMGNVLGGGKHAIGGTDIQEFLTVPQGETFIDSVFAGAAVHKHVASIIGKRYPDVALGKGDEGAWVAKVSNDEAMEIVTTACNEVSDEVGFPVQAAIDVAASSFFKDGKYHYADRTLDREGQVAYMAELYDKYDLFSIEDPFDEEDYRGLADLTEQIGDGCLIIGDDIFVTNDERLEKGIEMGSANAILIKPNQIGTLTRTIDTVRLAQEAGYQNVISHRSGETTDPAIAHLGIAFGSICIKTGAVSGERIAKLNELIRIEEEL
ncbi:MAG TPA: phosphopyruvate hydratase [Euryarchaeota archaeon]|nr:MAG: phosphopyruvate hydratase [Thermoplasmatales archaeon ex4484_6]HHD16759.1 phosphopyruvate hydratase [Euryarchaeota archaeon]